MNLTVMISVIMVTCAPGGPPRAYGEGQPFDRSRGDRYVLYGLMKYVLLGPVLRLFFPCTVIGAENIPERGGAILAGNHVSVADSFFAPLHMKRRVTFLAKSEYFTEKGLKGRLKKWFFTGVGQVPIQRGGASAAHDALATGVRLLGQGKLLGIYPEGTRSPDGRLYKGKTGVARMALQAGVPVVPMVMLGTEKVNPIGSKIWRPHRVTLVIGRPMDFSRYEGMAGDRFVERSMTDEIMYRVMELSGQEYVDMYATKRKAEMAEGGRRATVTKLPGQRAS
jgi:1-acyl-sn-glycerol-3-phosphate acyltransferase